MECHQQLLFLPEMQTLKNENDGQYKKYDKEEDEFNEICAKHMTFKKENLCLDIKIGN